MDAARANASHPPPLYHGFKHFPIQYNAQGQQDVEDWKLATLEFVSLMDKYMDMHTELNYDGGVASTFLRDNALMWYDSIPPAIKSKPKYWLKMRVDLIESIDAIPVNYFSSLGWRKNIVNHFIPRN